MRIALAFVLFAGCAPQQTSQTDNSGIKPATESDGSQGQPGASERQLTDEEIAALPRDERRTKYIEGFSCNRYVYGQPGFIRFEPRGVGYFGHQEDDVKFKWWVRDDKYCTQYPSQIDPYCVDFPKRDMVNERDKIQTWLRKGCN